MTHLSAYHASDQKLYAQEWFHFVDKEKQVRIRIDGKVNQMIAEAAELKQWTITEVCRPVSMTHLRVLDM